MSSHLARFSFKTFWDVSFNYHRGDLLNRYWCFIIPQWFFICLFSVNKYSSMFWWSNQCLIQGCLFFGGGGGGSLHVSKGWTTGGSLRLIKYRKRGLGVWRHSPRKILKRATSILALSLLWEYNAASPTSNGQLGKNMAQPFNVSLYFQLICKLNKWWVVLF